MALTVEDGSNVTGADAYVSLADADAYYLAYNGVAWPGTDIEKESAIRRATRYLDGIRWKGIKASGRSQPLEWPRFGVYDCDGYVVPSDEVPVEVVDACSLLSFYEAANPGGLDPNVTLTQIAKREKVDVIEVEYNGAAVTAQNVRPVITGAMDLIKCLTLTGGQRFLERA